MSEEKRKTKQKVTYEFPLDLIDQIRELAREDERSVNAEVVYALRDFVRRRQRRRQES